ncbi:MULTISPECIES: YueH family protein [Staphylococcus]|uniref:YueH family protein n=1 Tax=Staphylococcus TaxID=1279 RepID=UPI002E17C54F|nr:YueH family protein [Staphylococcus shinii]
MKVKKINFNDIQANVYIYENVVNQLFLIAIPEINWSLEVESTLNEDDMKEELVIHLFTLLDESTATRFADDIVKWILEN